MAVIFSAPSNCITGSNWSVTTGMRANDHFDRDVMAWFKRAVQHVRIFIHPCTVGDLNLIVQDENLAGLLYTMLADTEEMRMARQLAADRCEELNRPDCMANLFRVSQIPNVTSQYEPENRQAWPDSSRIKWLELDIECHGWDDTFLHARVQAGVTIPLQNTRFLYGRWQMRLEIEDQWWFPPIQFTPENFPGM